MLRSFVVLYILSFAAVVNAQWTTSRITRVPVQRVAGRAPIAVFDQITWEQGLPKGMARCIYRDHKGFLWLSVAGYGVIRYDGQQSRIFAPTLNDKSSFPATVAFSIAEDSKGILWFGTEKGLVRFDPTLEQFQLISRGHGSDYVNEMLVDQNDHLWVVYDNGCWLYDPATHKFVKIDIQNALNAYTGKRVDFTQKCSLVGLFRSRKGNIWASATTTNPLVTLLLRYDTHRKDWTFFPVPKSDKHLAIGLLKYVHEDESKVLCMNWESHLLQLDVPSGRWTQYLVSNLKVDSNITSAVIDNKHKIWFTTTDGTTGLLDPRSNTAAIYKNQAGNHNSPLTLNMMLGAYKDREGTIWWPSSKGVFMMNPRNQWLRQNLPSQFTPFPDTDGWETTCFDTTTQAFFAASPLKSKRWQILRMDKAVQTQTLTFENTGQLRLMMPLGGKILIGHQGLSFLDPHTMRLEHPAFPITNHPGLTTDSLFIQRRGAALPNGDFFLPTGEAVLYYSHSLRKFFLLETRNKLLPFSNGYEIGALDADSKGNVWGASSQGVVKIQLKPGSKNLPAYSLAHFTLFPKDSLPDDLHFCNWVDVSSGDTVWVGTNTGLYYLAPGSKRCRFIAKVNFFVSRLFSDASGNVWFKHSGGIGRYQAKRDRVDYFDERDGLVGEIYDRLLLADNGEFFFRGAYRWRPEQIPKNTQPPAVVFTSFKVFEQDFPLERSIDYQREIRLAAAQNFFSLGFAALNFQRPDKNEYAYRLIGVDTGWVYCGNRNYANYTNLAPGHYTFELKAANNDGVWSPVPRRLGVIIVPEWYQTLWFKWAVAIVLAALAWFFFKARLYAATLQANLQREKAEREKAESLLREKENAFRRKLAETEMAALRAQMNPHFIFNCLNSIKLYTEENDIGTASFYLTKFSRLIRRVLENSRSEKITLENELDALELYIQMEAMRFKEKVRYRIQVDEEIDLQFMCIPPLLLQPFVENAIWHGLMHKPEGGLIEIRLSVLEGDLLCVVIEDNGIGRDRAAALKSKSATQHKSLGMQVTSERIEAINHLYHIETKVGIEDLKDAQGRPCGTKVQLDIPMV
jgi:ligand-binding sensor domain-containing protein